MKNFIKYHKYELIIFVVLIIIAVISGININKTSDNQPAINNQISTNNSTNPASTTIKNTTNTPVVQNTQLNNSNTSTLSLAKFYELKASDYQLSPTATVYNLMQYAEIDSRRPFLFRSKTFSGMGEFVEEINGLKNNPQTGEYWIYYLNGQSAKIGISQQIVKPNDIITWKYTSQNDAF